MATEKKLMVVIGAKASEFNRAMADVKKQTKDISKTFRDVGRDMQTIGKGLTTSITLPIVAVGGAAVKYFGDFEQTMTQSTAIMGDLSEDMRKKMELAAREIGKTTKFGATEAAEAFEFLALAGLDAEQSIAALPQVAAFAQAGNFDLARATDLATDAQAALGMSSKNAEENLESLTRVTDVLTRAATLANANTEQFSEALTEKAGTALRNLKKDVEEGAAVLAVFADQGIKGGQAGTTLNATLEGLSRQAIKNEEVFREYNVEVFDAEGNMKNLANITADLEKALGDMSIEDQRATLMKMGFNRQALNGIQMLMGNSDAIREYEQELRIAGGTTQEVAEKQMDNLWDQLGLIKDQLIDVAIELGQHIVPIIKDSVLPMMERFVEWVGKLAEWFGNLSPFWQEFILKALALLAALGPVLLVVGKIVSAIGVFIPIIAKIIAVVKAVGTVIGAVAVGPVALIIAAIAAAIAIGILIWKNWDKIREKAIEIWGAIKDFFGNLWEGIKNIFSNTGKWISENVDGVWTSIGSFFSNLWESIKETFSNAIDAIVDFFVNLPGRISKFLLEDLPYMVGFAIGAAIKFFMELPDKIWEFLQAAWEKMKEWAANAWEWAKETGQNIIDSIIKFFSELPGKVWTWLTETFGKAKTWSDDMKKKAIEAGTNFLNSVIDFVKQLPGKVWDWLVETVKKIVNWISDLKKNAIEAGGKLLNSFIDEIKGLPDKVWSILKDAAGRLLEIGGELWDNAKRVASNLWEGFKEGLGISSPSYIERALMAIGEQSKDLVTSMRGDFRSLASLPMPEMGGNYTVYPRGTGISITSAGDTKPSGNTEPSAVTPMMDTPVQINLYLYPDKTALGKVVIKSLRELQRQSGGQLIPV